MTHINLIKHSSLNWIRSIKKDQAIQFGDRLNSLRYYTNNRIQHHCWSSLITVLFSNHLKQIGKNAFENDINITSLRLPQSLTTICQNTFMNTGINSVFFSDDSLLTTIEDYAFNKSNLLKDFQFPLNFQSIGNYCFISSSLESFTISPYVTTIGNFNIHIISCHHINDFLFNDQKSSDTTQNLIYRG